MKSMKKLLKYSTPTRAFKMFDCDQDMKLKCYKNLNGWQKKSRQVGQTKAIQHMKKISEI